MEKRDPVIEQTPSAPHGVETPAPPVAAPDRPRKSRKRPFLFALLPIVLIVGGYFYVTGGQTMTTDNAYVQADMVGVSTDVSGIVQSIEVHDNQTVKKDQILFRLDPAVYSIALAGAKAQLGVVRNQILNLEASYKQSLAEITQT
ncbi:MAG: biotin/lipoyl-binding protein, partial [Phyllobacterium sp.]